MKKRVYILPTGLGSVFILGAIVMILIGASYQNNLVNLLAFFMLSLIFIGMIQTHNNLRDVEVTQIDAEGGFAGGEFVLSSTLRNPSREPKFNLQTDFRKLKVNSRYENLMPLLSLSTLKLKSSHPAEKRGVYSIKQVRLSTTYPLGLFRAWMWLPTDVRYFIYPKCEGAKPLPLLDAGELHSEAHSQGGEDFHGHRKYQTGDSHRRVDWKAYARGRPLLIKEFNEGSTGTAALDWRQLQGLNLEAQLSQLALWIEEARASKIPFSLVLPDETVALGQGLQHATRCLEALAAYQPTKERANDGKNRAASVG